MKPNLFFNKFTKFFQKSNIYPVLNYNVAFLNIWYYICSTLILDKEMCSNMLLLFFTA